MEWEWWKDKFQARLAANARTGQSIPDLYARVTSSPNFFRERRRADGRLTGRRHYEAVDGPPNYGYGVATGRAESRVSPQQLTSRRYGASERMYSTYARLICKKRLLKRNASVSIRPNIQLRSYYIPFRVNSTGKSGRER